MKLILETKDLIQILERHFSTTFAPEMVQVRTSPFEVELTGIPLDMSEAPKVPERQVATGRRIQAVTELEDEVTDPGEVDPDQTDVLSLRSERNVSTTPPPYDPDETRDSPGAIVADSRALEAELQEKS
jgi:hypothetical protein